MDSKQADQQLRISVGWPPMDRVHIAPEQKSPVYAANVVLQSVPYGRAGAFTRVPYMTNWVGITRYIVRFIWCPVDKLNERM